MPFPSLHLALPAWVADSCPPDEHDFSTVEARMRFVLALAQRNGAAGTGGPFAAAVFDLDRQRLIAPGVNLVTSRLCSAAHAEIVALSLAQQRQGHYDLGSQGQPTCELVSSTEPCAMCMGAIPWSGVRSLVCGARGADACAIGMDEGAKPVAWVRKMEQRGICVTRDVCRAAAVAILKAYKQAGGTIYNARQGV